ncbi:hypothetical protein BSL78_06004 [Apostichopus japonicus]|uniref:Uncharacterized protein n=1 Tax=Stichopus japonicus TaxID=307972 RepID=A0A2G8LA12_STIJA|nr:hypothetical protein BSL78_06004 [Apostichopus japonicus]
MKATPGYVVKQRTYLHWLPCSLQDEGNTRVCREGSEHTCTGYHVHYKMKATPGYVVKAANIPALLPCSLQDEGTPGYVVKAANIPALLPCSLQDEGNTRVCLRRRTYLHCYHVHYKMKAHQDEGTPGYVVKAANIPALATSSLQDEGNCRVCREDSEHTCTGYHVHYKMKATPGYVVKAANIPALATMFMTR